MSVVLPPAKGVTFVPKRAVVVIRCRCYLWPSHQTISTELPCPRRSNHDGTVDFTEFYAWLSNPAREAEDKSGYKGRLLQARLAGNYFRKRFKAIGDAMGGGDGEFKVKHDPEYVPLDLTFGV